MISEYRFRFLNVERECDMPGAWLDSAAGKLWLYNLHYFDDLLAADAPQRAQWHTGLIARWIRDNGSTSGVGWESYPTSLRIANWIKWRMSVDADLECFDSSLAVQTRWLRRRIEHHLLGNHVLVNAKALIFAGVYFRGLEADGWRQQGTELLNRHLGEQILADGAHYELSPMYHSLVLEDLLDLINLAVDTPGIIDPSLLDDWREKASRMLGWLASVTHPDGDVALLNDAAFGIAPKPAELHSYGDRLAISAAGTSSAAASGYVRVDRGSAALIVDVAHVGPDEQPGHGHADTLTFELSLRGKRVIVDSGTSTYNIGPQREFERSTAAHNTVEIDGRNSSDVWSAFRVARRARQRYVSLIEGSDGVQISGSHDGYMHLRGRPIHSRMWRLTDRSLLITDCVSVAGHVAVARFLFHPSVIVMVANQTLRFDDGPVCRWTVTGAAATIKPATWYPEFGVCQDTHCLHCVFDGREATFELRWD